MAYIDFGPSEVLVRCRQIVVATIKYLDSTKKNYLGPPLPTELCSIVYAIYGRTKGEIFKSFPSVPKLGL